MHCISYDDTLVRRAFVETPVGLRKIIILFSEGESQMWSLNLVKGVLVGDVPSNERFHLSLCSWDFCPH